MFETKRLVLRQWQSSDYEPFVALNADPEVMRYFPKVLSRLESNGMIERIKEHQTKHGFGLWVLEHQQTRQFMGFIGLNIPTFQAHFTPTVEVGWRLAQPFWGHGYATEGARASLDYGFNTLRLPEIVSFTATINHRSIAVMQRLGMTTDVTENFDHPKLPLGHALRPHVLYRISKNQLGLPES
ncbi:MAG: GNAT family N-acetyltransferase [Cyanobacteria bacterium P01_F01_bin.150]